MIKIAHEAPIALFDEVQMMTDYDYALVHLLDENTSYRNKFKKAKKQGREVLLDNSIFELGTSFDPDKYKEWIVDLNPDWYIIPDVLEDAEATVKSVKAWDFDHPAKTIGVVQGKSIEEIAQCYLEVEPLVDKVAISFDYSFFVSEGMFGRMPTQYHYYMLGRRKMIEMFLENNIINQEKPHHLLGCGLPQEFAVYKDYKWIDSLDTSNPVVAGIKGMRYDGLNGLQDKPSQKLFTLIKEKPTQDVKEVIFNNIKKFRKIVNG